MEANQIVGDFLKLNGFEEKVINSKYINDKCRIILGNEYYTIIDNEDDYMYSDDLNIYWLIGMLTYHGYMDKNYKQI